jgi:hypothetical protein
MSRGAADNFEHAPFAQLPKRGQQIEFPFIDKKASGGGKELKIKLRELRELRLVLVPLSLARRKIDEKIEVAKITFAEQLVLQHRAERWRERHRELERHVVVHEPLHHLQQRDVSLGDRFEEPVFFEKMLVLRMPDEWQVRVKNKREMVHTRYRIPENGYRKEKTLSARCELRP